MWRTEERLSTICSPWSHSPRFPSSQPESTQYWGVSALWLAWGWRKISCLQPHHGFVLPAGAREAATVDSRCRQASHIMCGSTPPCSTISQLCPGRCTARINRGGSGLSSLSRRSSQRTALYQCNGTGFEGARLPSRSNGRWTPWQGWPSSWREQQNLCFWGFDGGTQKCKKGFWTSGSLWQCFPTVLQSSRLQVPCHNWCKEECEETHARIAGGIEVVWLAPNPAHTGYQVCVKRKDDVLEFYIECDRVARSFTILKKLPFFKESSAQKLKFIAPGSCALTKINPLAYLSFKLSICKNLLESCWSLPYSQDLLNDSKHKKFSSLAPCKVLLKPRPKPSGWGNFDRTAPVSTCHTSRVDCFLKHE